MALLRLALTILPFLAWCLYIALKRYRYDQLKAFPRLPPDLLWGHLKAVNEYIKANGPGRHIDYTFMAMQKAIGNPPIVIFDMRPFFWPICVIYSHNVAEQIAKPSKTFRYSVFKSPTVKALLPVIGPTSIIRAEGEVWKRLRKRFNPGFAPAHLVTLLPAIVSKTKRFIARLDALAKSGEEFKFDELCTSLTFDIIGAVVLDVDFKAQLPKDQQNQVVTQYRELAASFDDNRPFTFLDWKLRKRQKMLGNAVDTTIKSCIAEKFAELQKARAEEKDLLSGRSVLELSLQDTDELTPEILQESADQVKSFLFAGHDTTSILLQWAFYTLSIHPRVLATLCAELDSVFGATSDADSVAQQLLDRGEEALKQLSYTSAVIKEILRLYPPAGTARMAPKGSGYTVRLPDTGEDVCIDGFVLYNNHYSIQRDPAVYGDSANEFVPERWLGDTDTSMEVEFANSSANSEYSDAKTSKDTTNTASNEEPRVPPTAWRPFERGPRNCIGQELANLEARVILACAVRRFRFRKLGIGALVMGDDGMPILDAGKAVFRVEEEMFNRRQITSKPCDGMRMSVERV